MIGQIHHIIINSKLKSNRQPNEINNYWRLNENNLSSRNFKILNFHLLSLPLLGLFLESIF